MSHGLCREFNKLAITAMRSNTNFNLDRRINTITLEKLNQGVSGGVVKKLFKRWMKRLAWSLVLFFLTTIAMVWALRYVDPFSSSFMLSRKIDGRKQGGFELSYQWVDFDQMSPHVPVALMAAEDQKFPIHRGFDLDAIERAMDNNAKGKKIKGASTISQQVAKNLFLWSGRSYIRKGLEAYFTLLIEWMWPKQRILEVYANIAEFGDGVYGAESAAQKYFKKSAKKLGPHESAMLASVLPSPKKFIVNKPSRYQRQRARWIERQARQLGGQAFLKYLDDPTILQQQINRAESRKIKSSK